MLLIPIFVGDYMKMYWVMGYKSDWWGLIQTYTRLDDASRSAKKAAAEPGMRYVSIYEGDQEGYDSDQEPVDTVYPPAARITDDAWDLAREFHRILKAYQKYKTKKGFRKAMEETYGDLLGEDAYAWMDDHLPSLVEKFSEEAGISFEEAKSVLEAFEQDRARPTRRLLEKVASEVLAQ